MWYFVWILGLMLASAFTVLNLVGLERQAINKSELIN
ncbi:cytochrome bd-I oxidase subunit CydX [Vibrio rotiferianus]|uniref:Cytochrome bd-I oxidase subunit CydX n=1 Tax=Vibrio rotiferianus TaxID=190895 RepID=A0A7Y3Z5V6_9VIBR|nr:cytochrome bd-I oxidase subunit CydX [Vibrio rotiferianus]NOH46852.1 cytochrome bd-I oxidase subunit CydX [Vibrio rotiferianus]